MAQAYPYQGVHIPALDKTFRVNKNDSGLVKEIKTLPMGPSFILLLIDYWNGDQARFMLAPSSVIFECGEPIDVADPNAGPKIVVPTVVRPGEPS